MGVYAGEGTPIPADRTRVYRLALLTVTIFLIQSGLNSGNAQSVAEPYGGLPMPPPLPPSPDSADSGTSDSPPPDAAPSAPAAEPRDWRVTPYVSLGEQFTDNARLTPKGTPDFVTSVTPGAAVQEKTRRLQLTLDGNVTSDIYARNSGMDGYRYNFNGNGLGEIVEDYLFMDVRSSVGAEPVNATAGIPAFDRLLPGNQVQVINTSVSPYLAHDFGSWGSGELRYRASALDYSSANTNSQALTPTPAGLTPVNLSNSFTNEFIAGLKAGPQFTTFRWAIDGSASDSNYTDGRIVEQRSGMLTGEYAVMRELALIAKVGEDSYKDSAISSSTSANPALLIGARVTPGPRTDLLLEGGERYGGPYWSGQFRYRISKILNVTASHSESLVTQQDLSTDGLNTLVRDSQGRLADPLTSAITDPNATPFNLVGQSFSLKASRVGVNGVEGRNSFDLSAEYDQRVIGAVSLAQNGTERQNVVEFGGTVTRQLTHVSDACLSLSYANNQDSLAAGAYSVLQAGTAFDYNFNETLRGSLAYRHYMLTTNLGTGYAENAILASIRKSF